jgi:hypothetical protein
MTSVYCKSMIINKYPYQEIQKRRIEGKRVYDTESGFLPSVTTILEATKPVEAVKALNRWRDRVGHPQAQQITTEAANVGSRMHKFLETWAETGEFTAGNHMLDIVAKRMANTVIENISPHLTEVWGTEVSLYYPGLYAGTTDFPGAWKGKPTIMDFKQSNKPKKREWIKDYELQLIAYSLAHNELFGTEIRTGHVFMCSRDLEFQHFEITEDQFDQLAIEWAARVDQYYQLTNQNNE